METDLQLFFHSNGPSGHLYESVDVVKKSLLVSFYVAKKSLFVSFHVVKKSLLVSFYVVKKSLLVSLIFYGLDWRLMLKFEPYFQDQFWPVLM